MDISKKNNEGISFEKYYPVFESKEGVQLRAKGKVAEFTFKFEKKENKRYRLFNAGQTAIYYYWKSEFGCNAQYHQISDSLDVKHAYKAQYCLDFSSEVSELYVKRVHKQVDWPPMVWYIPLSPVPTAWKTGIFACAKNVKVEQGGYLRMRVDIRVRAKAYEEPEFSYLIDIPQNTYSWREISKDIEIPTNAKCVYCFVEGVKYSGELYLETPYLKASGQNLLCDFNMPAPRSTNFDWVGQNITKREWPKFEIKLNGKVFFKDEIFERCHCGSEWAVDIPQHLLKKKNKLSYRYISDYHDTMPYNLQEVAILEQPAGELAIISCSKLASIADKARILLRTEKENVKVSFLCESNAVQGEKEYIFKEKGLHGIALTCLKPAQNVNFTLKTETTEIRGNIERIAIKKQDNVLVGTGDMIYVEQTESYTEEYLSWYVSNNVGNFITVRPTYRWSGTRVINPKVWALFNRVLNELDMKYVLMFDGREAPGCDTQPSQKMLKGKGYMGAQRHEVCMHCSYQAKTAVVNDPFDKACIQLITEIRKENPEYIFPFDPISEEVQLQYFEKLAKGENIDFRWRKEIVVAYMRAARGGIATRHTGVTPYFKYFFEAGFSWVGAETMYSTHEQILSFLRGACRNIGQKNYGVHNAVQWSTYPHDTPDRFRRYRLALYDSYLLGASDINTEEGLWRIEEYWVPFNRFSKACIGHLKQEQDFMDYVTTHTRSGEFYTPVAFMHGRLDGTNLVVEHRTWGLPSHVTDAERSWGMMRVFYPLAQRNCIYRKPDCSATEPQGYYSGTPIGCVDAIPAECELSMLKNYKTVAFAGYHCFEDEDMDKLEKFANDGGRVLMSLVHFTNTSMANDIKSGNFSFAEAVEKFTIGAPEFVTSTKNGIDFTYCRNMRTDNAQVIATTDDNQPLLLSYSLGKGKIVVMAAKEYPAHKAIEDTYKEALESIGLESFDEENVWAKTDEKVTFAVYNQEDASKHVYFLAVDWYNEPEKIRKATLRIKTCEYEVKLPFGVMIKCVVNGESFAYPKSESAEVINLTQKSFTVQGKGIVDFVYGKNGQEKNITVDFTNKPVQLIEI